MPLLSHCALPHGIGAHARRYPAHLRYGHQGLVCAIDVHLELCCLSELSYGIPLRLSILADHQH